jgi:hypothetical protein
VGDFGLYGMAPVQVVTATNIFIPLCFQLPETIHVFLKRQVLRRKSRQAKQPIDLILTSAEVLEEKKQKK